MKGLERTKQRIAQLPYLFGQCSTQGANYAKCVTIKENVKRNDCLKEFNAFKECLHKAAKKTR